MDTSAGFAAQDLPFGYNHSCVLSSGGLQESKTPSPSHSFEVCHQQMLSSSKQSKECILANKLIEESNADSFQKMPQRKNFKDFGTNTHKVEDVKCKYCSIRMSMLRQLEKRKSAKSPRRRTLSSGISASHIAGLSRFNRGCQTPSALFKQAPMTKKENRCFMVVLRYRNGKPLRTETYCSCALHGREDFCSCGENNTSIEWLWDRNRRGDTAYVQQDARTVMFHQDYSCGTAAIAGNQLMDNDQYFWEIKMTTPVYGTDMMVGVGTTGVDLNGHHNEFCSMLGIDCDSWGFSYDGRVQHNGRKRNYCGRYGQGAIISAHLDMWHGTLTFFKNRRNLGIAYRGLQGKSIYPLACSTAARSAMRIVSSMSFPSSLQYLCARQLRKLVPDHLNVLDVLQMPPGLRRILSKTLGWLLRAPQAQLPDAKSVSSCTSNYICDICMPLKNVFEGYTDDEGEDSDNDNIHNGFNYLDSDDSEEDSEESDGEESLRPTSQSSLCTTQTAFVKALGQSVVTSITNPPEYFPGTSRGGPTCPKIRRLDERAPTATKEDEENSESEEGEGNSESEESILEQSGDGSSLNKSDTSEENSSSPRKIMLGKRKLPLR